MIQPLGWVSAPIGHLCSLNNGRAFKPTEWSTEGLPIVRIQNLNDPKAAFNHYAGEVGDRYHLKGGELLFAWSGTPGTSFGAHVWRGSEALLNQHIFRVDFDSSIVEKRFFRYAINQKLSELIGKAHGGVGLRHVTKSKFEETSVALPPRLEQTRIADRLDLLFSRLDACRERLHRVPSILRRFRKAVLEAAVSGKLTEDWRAGNPAEAVRDTTQQQEEPIGPSTLPNTWRWHTVADLSVKVVDGVHKKPVYVPAGIPFITVKNLTAGPGIDFSDTRFVSQADHQEFCRRTYPEKGDLLISKDGTLGVIRLVETDRPFSIFVSVALIKLKDKRLAPFMRLALESPIVQAQMVGVGSGLQHIHLQDLRKDLIPVPPIGEQAEIVRRVDELFGIAARLERRHADAEALVEKVTPSVMARAFRGELVPQDPNDEPAQKMLERLRSSSRKLAQKAAQALELVDKTEGTLRTRSIRRPARRTEVLR